MGLWRAAATICAWIEAGFAAWKNDGLANFCRPAKQNVNPRKARNGNKAQPASACAAGGGASHNHRARSVLGSARGAGVSRRTPLTDRLLPELRTTARNPASRLFLAVV